ncbi:hypothetical protein [Sphingomonas sp. DT-204]|uniref:hypothetical protein n=1 Tax=Sphingomonas sp. DT-204 TaxID=3396166 RepID=UPI003F1B8105
MSHTVFLNASSQARMPNGHAGEWQRFWDSEGEELEARYGIPIFWWCLFGSSDLKSARLIDDEDIGPDARDELHDEIGEDATYPYLVTSQKMGLQRLDQRRAHILAAIGNEHAAAYDAFGRLIERHFAPFILLRTSDLPDIVDAKPWLAAIAAELDGLDAGAPMGPELKGMADEIRRGRPADAIWRLSGSGDSDVWPTPELIPASGPSAASGSSPPRRGRIIGIIVEWLPGVVTAGVGIGVFLWTSSVIAGGLAFAACAAVMVWLLVRRER